MPFIAPIIAGIAGAVGIGAAGASLIGSIGAVAVSVGLSFLASKMKGNQQQQTVSGSQTTVKFGGDVPRQVIFGTAATAGHQIFINSYGASNSNEQEVYVLADSECDSLVGIIVDGVQKKLVAQTPIGGEDARFWVYDNDGGSSDPFDDGKNYGSKLEIRFYRGRASQTADAGLVANSSGRWTSAHRGDGVCYVVVDKTYDPDLFSGWPTFKFVVKGAKVYDWRKDSSAGGSGSHRWADRSTWEHSANPAVCLYNYQRGFFLNGKLVMGEAVPASDLPLDLYTAAASISDEVVELAAGGTEARYAVSAIAVDNVEHRTIMESLVGAMAGYLYEQAGIYLPVAGSARTVVSTFTDDDLLLDGAVKFARKRSRADLANYISGSFTSPDDLWESKGYTPVSSSINEAADGERLGRQIDLLQISSQPRAERIAKIRYNEVRCQTTATVPLSLRQIGIEVGDWVRWNSARYGDRTYRVSAWRLSIVGGQIGMQIGLSEVNTAVYGWNPATDQGAQISSGQPRLDAYKTRTVSGLTLQATSVTSSIGEAIPAILVTWSPISDTTVLAVTVQYRPAGSSSVSVARSDSPASGSLTISGLLSGADYEVRATIITDPPRATSWTEWQSITTSIAALPAVVDSTTLVPSLAAELASLPATVDAIRATMLREQLARVGDRERAWSIGARVQTTVTEQWTAGVSALASRVDTVEAGISPAIGAAVTTEATARANADTALGSRIDTIETGVGTANAAVASEATARATADTALAGQITALSTAVGDASAEGGIKFALAADQTGALARYELWLKATSGTFSATAAMTLEVIASGGTNYSQIKFKAGRFLVMGDDGTSVVPFSVVGGTTYIDTLQVRHTINIGQSGSGGEIIIWGP